MRLQCCARCSRYYPTKQDRVVCSQCRNTLRLRALRKDQQISGRLVGEAMAKFYEVRT